MNEKFDTHVKNDVCSVIQILKLYLLLYLTILIKEI